jgi:hypothetical protein
VAIYHRLEADPNQTRRVARLQEESSEIWGRPPRLRSDIPAVKAYPGPLPEHKRGIEFETDVPPDKGSPPATKYWRGPRSGVRVEGEFAKIKVRILKNTQT